jgi:hypothetical protein
MPIVQSKLRRIGLRGYFSLKGKIDIRNTGILILFKLFDALARPIAAYACQVWLPSTGLFKLFIQAIILYGSGSIGTLSPVILEVDLRRQ